MENLNNYEGQVLNGMLHGKGKLTSAKGMVVEGTFENGRPEGEVKFYHPDGRIYLLQIKESKVEKKELIQGKKKEPINPDRRSPFRTVPKFDPKPKGGGFFFPSQNLGEL